MKWACIPQPHPFRDSKLLQERKDTLLLTLAFGWPGWIGFLCKMVGYKGHLMDHLLLSPEGDPRETAPLEGTL